MTERKNKNLDNISAVDQMIDELDSNGIDDQDTLTTNQPKIDIDRLDVLDVLHNILDD